MRPSSLLILLSIALSPVAANWFSSGTSRHPARPYTTWAANDLVHWLNDHNIPVPTQATRPKLQELVEKNWNSISGWSYEQYLNAQKTFGQLEDSSFEAWDESRLRQFLLEHGVVDPKGPREQLVLLAKQKYKEYSDAARTFADRATAVTHSEPTHVTDRVASFLSHATADASRRFHESEDYFFETWDDNRLRRFLQEKGFLEANDKTYRKDLLSMVKDAYNSVAEPVWNAWSNSYMRNWLVSHGLITADQHYEREDLLSKMRIYYYDVNDAVWHTWSDAALRKWLLDHEIIHTNAQVSREKMIHLVADNYHRCPDTFWDAWSDTQLHNWLVEHGYIRADKRLPRHELINLANQKFADVRGRYEEYLTWPDARLRAFLRDHDIPEEKLPTTRPGLLQECRIRYVQYNRPSMSPTFFSRLGNAISSTLSAIGRPFGLAKREASDAARAAEERVRQSGDYLSEKVGEGKDYLYENVRAGSESASHHARAASEQVSSSIKSAGDYAQDRAQDAQDYARNRAQAGKEQVRMGSDYANDRADDVRREAYRQAEGSKNYVGSKVEDARQYGQDKAAEAQYNMDHASRVGGEYVHAARERAGETVKQAGRHIKGEL